MAGENLCFEQDAGCQVLLPPPAPQPRLLEPGSCGTRMYAQRKSSCCLGNVRECSLWHRCGGCALLTPSQVALRTHRKQVLSAPPQFADKSAGAQSGQDSIVCALHPHALHQRSRGAGPWISSFPGNLLERRILGPHPRLAESQLCRWT